MNIKYRNIKGVSLPTVLFTMVALAISASLIVKSLDTSNAVTSAPATKYNSLALNSCISDIALNKFKGYTGACYNNASADDTYPCLDNDMNAEGYTASLSNFYGGNNTTIDANNSNPYSSSSSFWNNSVTNNSDCNLSAYGATAKYKIVRSCQINGKPTATNQQCVLGQGVGSTASTSSYGYDSYNFITHSITSAVFYKLYVMVSTQTTQSNQTGSGGTTVTETTFTF